MDRNICDHISLVGANLVEKLRENGFKSEFFVNKELATECLIKWIQPYSTIGLPGSVTIKELNILPSLIRHGCTIFDMEIAKTEEEKYLIGRSQLTCDVLLSSTNAMTEEGWLYNVDGTGNRVAAMTYGPQMVIIVVGMNKIVRDLKEAEMRVSNYVAPINCRRLNYPNPCVKTGKCVNCQGFSRICNATLIIKHKPKRTDIRIILVGESLGY